MSTNAKRDRTILAVVSVIALIAIPTAFYYNTGLGNEEPARIYTKDGCDVYTFKYDSKRHYFVNCPKDGRSATTYKVDGYGAHIVTEQH